MGYIAFVHSKNDKKRVPLSEFDNPSSVFLIRELYIYGHVYQGHDSNTSEHTFK